MRIPTFTTFLKKNIHRMDLVGFFAREWLADHRTGKPTATKGLKGIVTYLMTDNAMESKVTAARLAWYEWIGSSRDDRSEVET